MNSLRKYRPRPSRRTRFASHAKPRVRRGIPKKGALPKAKKTTRQRDSAAAGQPSGRRVNRLPEWTDPRSYITKGGRHRLKGEDYLRMRWTRYRLADGRCECGCGRYAHMGYSRPHPCAGELAHKEHGPRKSDEIQRVRWLNWQCHEREHNCGGKPIRVSKRSIK
jgi:hypothetical protein